MENKAEMITLEICHQTFLSLWCYPNPRRSKTSTRELCDILVVCDPDVIIFSVKEIQLTKSKDPSIAGKRWERKAIEESTNQIYGAERILKQSTYVIKNNGETGLQIPDSSRLRIHRIAVAFGSEGSVIIPSGDFGKGFVHVFDEEALELIMRELDTITDFIEYLLKKESFLAKSECTVLGGEENLLAYYLQEGRSFPITKSLVIIDGSMWEDFTAKKEYLVKKQKDRLSIAWDKTIETVYKGFDENRLLFGPSSLSEIEESLRVMAKEDRFSRRILSEKLFEFLGFGKPSFSRSRVLPSPSSSDVIYIFLKYPLKEKRERRIAELADRCFIIRGEFLTTHKIIVGIATEEERGQGRSYDLCYVNKPDWTEDDERKKKELLEFGYFENCEISRYHASEYPESS